MELFRRQIYITPAQDRAVKLLAQRQGTTETEILRQAIDQFLIKYGVSETRDPFDDLIGRFEGPSEVAHPEVYSRRLFFCLLVVTSAFSVCYNCEEVQYVCTRRGAFMPTQEERLSALEQTVAVLNRGIWD